MPESSALGELFIEGPSDPDAQATVTDFIDYTEYLPSDLVRSLTLIRGLDERYVNATASVHELTKVYGQLPNLPAESRPQPHILRKQISEQLRRAVNARESAYAESCRLYDLVDHYVDRLGSIKSKLCTILANLGSVKDEEAATEKGPGTAEGAGTAPRITLRVDGQKASGATRRQDTAAQKKSRSQKPAALKTGAALPESPAVAGPSLNLPLDHALEKTKKEKQPKKQKSAQSTNKSAADAAKTAPILEPPPEDAVIGGEYRPWLRLTEWEMARLRKKMKKNIVWQPSDVMIQRELALGSRGWEGYLAAKQKAEEEGTEFVDCDDIMNTYSPSVPAFKGAGMPPQLRNEENKTVLNRGMKLNEAKKQKRESLAREQAAALAAAEAEMAAKRLGNIGSTFKNLFSSPVQPSQTPAPTLPAPSVPPAAADSVQNTGPSSNNANSSNNINNASLANDSTATPRLKIKPSTSKKRKHDELVDAVPSGQEKGSSRPTSAGASPSTKSAPKRLQLTMPASETQPPATGAKKTAKPTISLKLPVLPPRPGSKLSSPMTSPAEPKSAVESSTRRRLSSVSKAVRSATPPAVARTSSRRRSITSGSVDSTTRDRLRPGRRSKRPAPGPVTAGENGGSAVSIGKRKAKPAVKKKRDQKDSNISSKAEDIRIDEDGVVEEIDPNEPRYCLCGDVSFGTMICCEDDDCETEWFHLDCVGLPEVPSRLAKWYCPECRKKLDKIPLDGIVRNGGRR
ncbi:PHD finger protein [Trichophyton mentagrophytes]|nr:PHD finger protein [Trichophyton mentagrophytes]